MITHQNKVDYIDIVKLGADSKIESSMDISTLPSCSWTIVLPKRVLLLPFV